MKMNRILSSFVVVAVTGASLGYGSTDAAPPKFNSIEKLGCSRPLNAATYIGNFNGARAIAIVGFEPLRGNLLMSGKINSGRFYYTFGAELMGNRGWGTLIDHYDGSRIRIQIDATLNGFLLTLNPFGYPTVYSFTRQ